MAAGSMCLVVSVKCTSITSNPHVLVLAPGGLLGWVYDNDRAIDLSVSEAPDPTLGPVGPGACA